jgi:hypothetical protein
MKLLRLATLYLPLDSLPKGLRAWHLNVGEGAVESISSWEVDARVRLLLSASITIARPDEQDGWVLVPEAPRRQCEQMIEIAANMMAVSRRCSRSISSPNPPVAFLPETAEDAQWLDAREGIFRERVAHNSVSYPIEFDVSADAMKDRLDGFALMAEALSIPHPSGRFHEFTRVFERAFGRSGTHLTEPLAQFLAPAPQGFSRREVDTWILKIRDPLTHADKRTDIAYEADARRVIRRMEEAAFDALFNKAVWRDRSTTRRETLRHLAGTRSSERPGDLFVTQGMEGLRIEAQLLDLFGSYPLDLSAGITTLPTGWWAPRFTGEVDTLTDPQSDPQGAGHNSDGTAQADRTLSKNGQLCPGESAVLVLPIVRNQQVTRSSRVVGSTILRTF